jgi:hypothetical protein
MNNKTMKGASLIVVAAMVAMVFAGVQAAPVMPYTRFGDGSPNLAPVSTLITAWIDGVEYGQNTSSATGTYTIETTGDELSTTTVKEGGVNTNTIYYVLGGHLTTASVGQFASQTDTYTAGAIVEGALSDSATTERYLKINNVSSQSTITGGPTDYVVIWNPAGATATITDYSLAVGTAASQAIIAGDIPTGLYAWNVATVPASGFVVINMAKWGGLSNTGNSIKLIHTATGFIVDRVEYGTIATQPENTILTDAANPASGNEIHRTTAGTDTNSCSVDFTSGANWLPKDTTAPVSSADAIAPYWRNTSPITITATATDAVGVTYVELWFRYAAVNGTYGAWTKTLNDTASPWSFSFAFASGQGWYQFYTRAGDAAGNYELAPAAADRECGYDNVVPTSSVDAIAPYWFTTTPQTITATASDATSGVRQVALYYRYAAVNGTYGAWTLSGTDTASPWSWSYAFASGQGWYQFYTIATDMAGNVEAAPGTPDEEVGFDNVAPTSSVDAIAPYWKNTSPQTITATASDATSGVRQVALYYRYAAVNGTYGAWTLSGTDTASPWSWSYAFASGQGWYQFYTVATDIAGNVEAVPGTADRECGYDNVAPTSSVDAIAPYWKNTSPQTITATASDATSGVRQVALYYRYAAVNGTYGAWTLVSTDTASPWSWSYAFASGQGWYQFYTVATDMAGNVEAVPGTADRECGYDNVAPTSAVDAMTPYWRNTTPATVTATASDATSGVRQVALYYRYAAVNGTYGAWTLSSTDTASPWSFSYAFASGQGWYQFYSIATDMAMNVEAAPGVADTEVGYDTVAPTSSVDAIAPYWKTTSPQTITATASDATSGVRQVALYYRYAAVNGTYGAWTLVSTDTASPWSWSYAFASGQGWYQFYTIATDMSGNVEAAPGTADRECGYDSVLPASAVDAIAPYLQTTSPLTITATASDATSGLANVELWYAYSADNVTFGAYANFGTDSATPWSWSFNFPSGAGYYRFYTRAHDVATNYEAVPGTFDRQCRYNPATPTATATGPIGSGVAGVTITYTWTLTPTSVTLYYTTNGGTSWTACGPTDNPVDGSYAFTCPAPGTYGWIAVAIGGGSVETDPPAGGTVPEAASYIYGSSPAPRPQGLTVTRVSPNVVLTWTNATNPTTDWNIYYSTNKFAAFPGGWTTASAVATARTWTHTNALNDGNTWYYIVRGDNSGTESANSTMGVKVHKAFTVNGAPKTNVMWVTLPQDCEYATASDIVIELEGALTGAGLDSKINALGKWIPGDQAATGYVYESDFEEWTGDDFSIGPGDGIYLSITSSFNWVFVGVDTGVQLSFTVNSAPKTNVMWFNLPATSTYATASDIVLELEGALTGAGLDSKINAIGKWIPGDQAATGYVYESDFEEWTGDDFSIAPGDGIYLSITSSFTWTPDLLTAAFP